MIRLLFTLTFVVLLAAHGEYCITLEFELQIHPTGNFVSLKASLDDATLKNIKLPQNNRRIFSLRLAATTDFFAVNRTVILENALTAFVYVFVQ